MAAETPAWFEDSKPASVPAPAPAAPALAAPAPAEETALTADADERPPPTVPDEEPKGPILEESDIVNTKWAILISPRDEGWIGSDTKEGEVTLLADGSVVWGGWCAGWGVGGRWQLKDGVVEIIRTTPLGLATGRDYYMANARAELTKQLQFALKGVVRSYNAAFPVTVVGDFVAVRLPGRFAFVSNDEE